MSSSEQESPVGRLPFSRAQPCASNSDGSLQREDELWWLKLENGRNDIWFQRKTLLREEFIGFASQEKCAYRVSTENIKHSYTRFNHILNRLQRLHGFQGLKNIDLCRRIYSYFETVSAHFKQGAYKIGTFKTNYWTNISITCLTLVIQCKIKSKFCCFLFDFLCCREATEHFLVLTKYCYGTRMQPFNFPERLFGLQDSSYILQTMFYGLKRFMVVKILEVCCLPETSVNNLTSTYIVISYVTELKHVTCARMEKYKEQLKILYNI